MGTHTAYSSRSSYVTKAAFIRKLVFTVVNCFRHKVLS
jgi:hypothetical protein